MPPASEVVATLERSEALKLADPAPLLVEPLQAPPLLVEPQLTQLPVEPTQADLNPKRGEIQPS